MSRYDLLFRIMRLLALLLLAGNLFALTCFAAENDPEVGSLNKAERLEWFRDQGFGLFIHWSVDSQLGVVISHSLVGASPEYTDRFFKICPRLLTARFSSIGLGSFGASGRCSLRHVHDQAPFRLRHVRDHDDPFGIMNTPFHRDITRDSLRRLPFPGYRRRRLLFAR